MGKKAVRLAIAIGEGAERMSCRSSLVTAELQPLQANNAGSS